MTWEQIENANNEIAKVSIKGKKYSMVKDKILAFRKIEPNASFNTEILHFDGMQVVVKATVFIDEVQVGSGLAEEKCDSTFINKTSFVENCETSAIGRALSSIGIGVEDSYASDEEVVNAIMNQEGEKEVEKIAKEKIKDIDIKVLEAMIKDSDTDKDEFMKYYKIKDLSEMNRKDYAEASKILQARIDKKEK